jgi:hypothetical protein
MQRTAKHARFGDRPGLVRRLFGRGPSSSLDHSGPPDFLDLSEAGDAITRARIERLEEGLHLMAQTMKETYGRLTSAVDDVRRSAVRATVRSSISRDAGRPGAPEKSPERPVGEPVVLPSVQRASRRTEDLPDTLTVLRRARFASPEGDLS